MNKAIRPKDFVEIRLSTQHLLGMLRGKEVQWVGPIFNEDIGMKSESSSDGPKPKKVLVRLYPPDSGIFIERKHAEEIKNALRRSGEGKFDELIRKALL